MSKNDGGPAFPHETYNGKSVPFGTGMSLRDWFAGTADPSVLPYIPDFAFAKLLNIEPPSCDDHFGRLVFEAKRQAVMRYICADAMIAERDK